MISSAKVGDEKTATSKIKLGDIWLELGRRRETLKLSLEIPLLLKGKEAEINGSANLNSNREPSYLHLIGDS